MFAGQVTQTTDRLIISALIVFNALSIAVTLCALWAMLLLNTIVRLSDPCGHLAYREFVYCGFRADKNRLQIVTSALCGSLVLAVHLASALESGWPLIPAFVVGSFLIIGVIHVVRNLHTMRFENEEVDPCWQALLLALTWPVWSRPVSITTSRR